MIAMALACGPELLIADEPTTALGRYHTGADTQADEGYTAKKQHEHHNDNP
jgi:ABC-type lipoprotein export system ATPase subunit